MSTEYTPDEETVREQYSREQPPHIGTVSEKRAEVDRFIAQVRRDAARGALTELADYAAECMDGKHGELEAEDRNGWHRTWAAAMSRRANYPEVTP